MGYGAAKIYSTKCMSQRTEKLKIKAERSPYLNQKVHLPKLENEQQIKP